MTFAMAAFSVVLRKAMRWGMKCVECQRKQGQSHANYRFELAGLHIDCCAWIGHFASFFLCLVHPRVCIFRPVLMFVVLTCMCLLADLHHCCVGIHVCSCVHLLAGRDVCCVHMYVSSSRSSSLLVFMSVHACVSFIQSLSLLCQYFFLFVHMCVFITVVLFFMSILFMCVYL